MGGFFLKVRRTGVSLSSFGIGELLFSDNRIGNQGRCIAGRSAELVNDIRGSSARTKPCVVFGRRTAILGLGWLMRLRVKGAWRREVDRLASPSEYLRTLDEVFP